MSAMATIAPERGDIKTPGGIGATRLSPASVIFLTTMPAKEANSSEAEIGLLHLQVRLVLLNRCRGRVT